MTPAERIAVTRCPWLREGVLASSESGLIARVTMADVKNPRPWLSRSRPVLTDHGTRGIIEGALREEGYEVRSHRSITGDQVFYSVMRLHGFDLDFDKKEWLYDHFQRAVFDTYDEALAAACELAWPKEEDDD